MAAALTDEPAAALAALQAAIAGLRCSSAASRTLFDGLAEQLATLQPQLADSIAAMRDAAAFGQTIKQSQSKALQEFSGAVATITAALTGASPPTSSSTSTNGARAASGSGRRPVLPDGVCPLNPDAFFHARLSLAAALGALAAAFKGAALGEVAAAAKEEVEDLGLFE